MGSSFTCTKDLGEITMKALNAHVVGNIVFLQLESQLSQMLYHQKSVSIYWRCDMLYILVQHSVINTV